MTMRKPSRRFASGGTRPTPIYDEDERNATAPLLCFGKRRRDLFQLELLNLAAGGTRKLSHHLDTFRPELLRHLGFAQIGLHSGQIDRAPGPRNDERAAALAEPRVRKADHGDRGNRGMLVEEVLDLDDRYVFPAPDQDVLYPARNTNVAFLVHVSEITGIEPSIAVEGLQIWPLVIALEHLGAANEQASRLTHGDRPALEIDDTDFHPVLWPTIRARRLPRPTRRLRERARQHFCHTPERAHFETEFAGSALDEDGRNRRASAQERAQVLRM